MLTCFPGRSPGCWSWRGRSWTGMSTTAAGARPARHPSRASALAWPSKPSDGSDTAGQDAWNGPTKPSPSRTRHGHLNVTQW